MGYLNCRKAGVNYCFSGTDYIFTVQTDHTIFETQIDVNGTTTVQYMEPKLFLNVKTGSGNPIKYPLTTNATADNYCPLKVLATKTYYKSTFYADDGFWDEDTGTLTRTCRLAKQYTEQTTSKQTQTRWSITRSKKQLSLSYSETSIQTFSTGGTATDAISQASTNSYNYTSVDRSAWGGGDILTDGQQLVGEAKAWASDDFQWGSHISSWRTLRSYVLRRGLNALNTLLTKDPGKVPIYGYPSGTGGSQAYVVSNNSFSSSASTGYSRPSPASRYSYTNMSYDSEQGTVTLSSTIGTVHLSKTLYSSGTGEYGWTNANKSILTGTKSSMTSSAAKYTRYSSNVFKLSLTESILHRINENFYTSPEIYRKYFTWYASLSYSLNSRTRSTNQITASIVSSRSATYSYGYNQAIPTLATNTINSASAETTQTLTSAASLAANATIHQVSGTYTTSVYYTRTTNNANF